MTRRKSADQLWSELSCHFGPEHAAILMHDEKMAIREAILREATPDRANKLEALLLAAEEVDSCWRVDDSLFVFDDRLEPRLTALRHALEEYDNG